MLCFTLSHAFVISLSLSILLPVRARSLRQTPPKTVVLVLNDYLSSDGSATATDYEKLSPLWAYSSELQSLL